MAIFKESKIKTSILVTLTLLFFFIGVIPLLISNWKLILINREALETTLRENFVTTAEGVSTQIGEYIKLYRGQVQEFDSKALGKLQSNSGLEEPPALMKDPNILKVRILNLDGKGPYAQKFNFQDPQVPSLEFEAF